MNGQLGNHGWGRAVCVSVFLVVCVFLDDDNKEASVSEW